MKKVLCLAVVMFFLVGCGGKVANSLEEPFNQTNVGTVPGFGNCGGEYEAKWGDTLADIAWAKWHGRFTYLEILKVNPNIKDPNLIYAGVVYSIPSPEAK